MKKSLLLLALCTCIGQAGVLHVIQDTSMLVSHPAAPFFVEFQFNDGRGIGDANNLVSVDNFDFGAGFAGGTIANFGGVTGDMFGKVQLTDSEFFNLFYQEFTPGNTLSFDVHFTQTVDAGPQPDQWSFAIMDCSNTELPTSSPANALMSIDISAPINVGTFAGSASGVLGCTGGPSIPLPAPAVSGIPEPATIWLSGGALLVVAGRRRMWP